MDRIPRVFLWGDNSLSRELAFRLREDYQVFWAAGEEGRKEKKGNGVPLVSGLRLLALRGTLGNFEVELEGRNGKQKVEADLVVICPQEEDEQELALYETLRKSPPLRLVVGLGKSPGVFQRAVEEAADAALRGHEITMVAPDQLVGRGEGQSLLDQARRRGVRFVRGYIQEVEPKDGLFEVDLVDEQLPSLGLIRVKADRVFRLGEVKDFQGLPQEVVRLAVKRRQEDYPAGTLRRGVFVVAEGWGEPSSVEVLVEVVKAALAARPKEGRYAVRSEDCALCLNCYRVCPHAAVVLGREAANLYGQAVFIDPWACHNCGICWAECPALAIEVKGELDERKDSLGVWACENAAAWPAENGGISVRLFPCAGSIGLKDMLAGFGQGLEKIYILTCHPGKCQHEYGEARLRKRAAKVNEMMRRVGLKHRVEVKAISGQDSFKALIPAEAGEKS